LHGQARITQAHGLDLHSKQLRRRVALVHDLGDALGKRLSAPFMRDRRCVNFRIFGGHICSSFQLISVDGLRFCIAPRKQFTSLRRRRTHPRESRMLPLTQNVAHNRTKISTSSRALEETHRSGTVMFDRYHEGERSA
jgi:hypothetical protein